MARFTQDGGTGGGGGAVTIGPNFGDGSPTVALSVGAVTVQGVTTDLLADKDSWCDVIAACPVDVTHDATDLQADGITATRKDMIFGWDLSAYPTGATVSVATLTLNSKTLPTVNAEFTPNLITQATEGWTEGTVKCSNIPPTDGVGGAVFFAAGGGTDVSSVLNATARTRMAARMGVGSFSLRITVDATGTNSEWESADEGTDNALGPRLTFTYTKTL